MQFVSLNLDLRDAHPLRRALTEALAGCRCDEVLEERCATCDALTSIVKDLDSLLDSRQRARVRATCDLQSPVLGPSQSPATSGCAVPGAARDQFRVVVGGLGDE